MIDPAPAPCEIQTPVPSQARVLTETVPTVWKLIPFGTVCLLILSVNLAVILGLRFLVPQAGVDHLTAIVVLGTCFAQLGLAAAWVTLISYSSTVRVSFAMVAMALACLTAFQFGIVIRQSLAIALAATFALQCALCQLPLWLARAQGWRISQATEAEDTAGAATQFGIRQLLLWTTIVGALMALARGAIDLSVPPQNAGATHGMHTDLPIGILFAVVGALLLFPVIWTAFAQRRFLLWLALIALTIAVVTPLEFLVFQKIVPTGRRDFWMISLINAGQVGITLTALLSLRFAGFRMRRVGPTESPSH